MPHTAEASPSVCASKGMGFNCTTQFDEINVAGHGDYWPTCTNSTKIQQRTSPLPEPTTACGSFDAFADWSAYKHRAELAQNETWLMWNVKGSEIEMKMVHHKRVGWLSVGAENVGGKRVGMNGAHIVMGLYHVNGSTWVGQYRIHDSNSGFRWWNNQTASTVSKSAVEITECYSALSFTGVGWFGSGFAVQNKKLHDTDCVL